AFKPNTDDMREAPSRVIAYRLLSEGAEVRAWDPVAHPTDLVGIELSDTILDAVRDADAAVIVTEWPQLATLASAEVREAMANPLIVDGRNLLDPEATQAAGFAYEEDGPVLALNGDELLDVDFGELLAAHQSSGAAATIVVSQVRSPFGVVAMEEDGTISGFREAPLLSDWVNSGVYALGPEALARLPERGDHEQTPFPELAAEGKLRGHRHQGVWLTGATPQDR